MVIQVIKTFFVQFCIFLPSLDLLGLLYQKKRGDIFLSPNGLGASQVMLVVKNLPANAGEIKDVGSIPGSGKIPGGGHSNPLQYSCLENPMDRGAWWVTVHGVAKSQTRLKRLTTHTHTMAWGISRAFIYDFIV